MPPRKAVTAGDGRAPQLLTLKEAGERMGVSHDSVERLVDTGDLDVVNVGSGQRPRLRVSESALAAFIAARTISAPGKTAAR